MEIFGLEKVSFVDYENHICATVFTGGCNFLCPFCHNAGLVKKEYKKYSPDEVLCYLASRKNLLDGVTISGGEPTLQKDLPSFIAKIKDLGYKVKLDTNGTNWAMLEHLISNNLIDYVAMDIKNCFEKYPAICGVPSPNISEIQKSLRNLAQNQIPYELRTTLVEQFHTEESIAKMAKELASHKTIYLQKFVDSGSCMQNGLSEVPKEKANHFKESLAQTIQNVDLRGY